MASPNETKLSEQQSSNSIPTTPPAPVAAESPCTEVAESQAQEEDEEAILAPRAGASDTENHHFEQAQGNPSPVAPDTAVEDTRAGTDDVESQQPDPTETLATVPATATNSNGVASHDEEDSDFDSTQWSDFEGIEDYDDASLFDKTPPNSPTSGYPNIQELGLLDAGSGQEIRIGEDPADYGIHGEGFQDYPETVSEFNAWDEEESDAISNPQADQATPDRALSGGPAESARANGGFDRSATGAAARSDHDEAVATAPRGSSLDNGDENDSATPASPEFDHGDAATEGGSSAIPELTSGSSEEESSKPVTPNSTGFNHEHEERGRSAASTPAGSGRDSEENRALATASSAGSDNADRDSSGSMRAASASSDRADEHIRGSTSSKVSPEVDTPALSREGRNTQREAREDDVPASGPPMEATSGNTTNEGEVRDPEVTPAQGDEETNKPS